MLSKQEISAKPLVKTLLLIFSFLAVFAGPKVGFLTGFHVGSRPSKLGPKTSFSVVGKPVVPPNSTDK